MGVRVRLVAAALLGVAACGSSSRSVSESVKPDLSAPAKLIGGQPLYVPGEYLSFKVKWKGFAGGSTQLVVGQPGLEAGRNALVIRSITATEGLVAVFKHVRDELTTFVDLGSGAPFRNQNNIESGREQRSVEVEFGDRQLAVEHNPPGKPRESWTEALPEDGPWAHDMHSILAHIRAWNPPLGTRGFAYVHSAREFFRLELVAAGRDVIDVPAGRFEAIRYEGAATVLRNRGKPQKPVHRKMRFWISAGPERLPVKLLSETQYGDVYAVLVEHRRGEAPEIRSGDYAAASRAVRTASR